MKSPPIVATLALFGLVAATQAAEHQVSTPESLKSLLPQIKPGDQIIVAKGHYADCAMELGMKGTAEQPIEIRAAEPESVVFTGRSKLAITGEHLLFRDFTFEGCKVTNKSVVLLENAKNCRVTACRFTGSLGKKNDQVIRVTARSNGNRVDHCSFVGNEARGVQIHVEDTWQTEGYPTGTRVDHNLFQDIPSVKHGEGAANGRETIQVGQGGSAESEPRTIVEFNIFLRCNGENECISNKTSANVYRYNSFQDQVGCLSLRGAAHCVVEGNRLENTPGIHVQGSGHTIIHNLIIRSGGSRVPGKQGVAGSIALGYGMPRTPESAHPQHYKAAEKCLVANNTIVDPPLYGLVIGGGRNQDWRDKGVRSVPPSGNRIVNNLIAGQTGDLMSEDAAPDNLVDHNLIFAGGDAKASFYGQNPLKTPPQFLNAAAGDYRLAPGSPGLNAGLPIPEVPNSTHIGAPANPVDFGPGEGRK